MTKQMIDNIIDNTISDMSMDNMIDKINTLKYLGILSQDIRVEKKNAGIEFMGMLIGTTDQMKEILIDIKKHDQSIEEWEQLCEMKKIIKIGTEFTFRDKEGFNFTMQDLNEENANNQKQITAAGEEIKRWIDEIIEKKEQFSNRSQKIDSLVCIAGNKKHNSSKYEAKKLDFKLYDGNEKETTDWSLNFDLDPGCIELQTSPISYKFYLTYGDMIERLIFQTTELKPDICAQTGGGGHISLDFDTAFQNNPIYLKNFLVLYAYKVANVSENDILVKSRDIWNAPFMHENGEIHEFIKVINDFNKMSREEATVEWLVENINGRVYTELHSDIKGQGVKISDAPHYQAINIEHITNSIPLRERRVEMRRFDAQQNIGELREELDCLYNLLQKSWVNLKLNLEVNNEGKIVLTGGELLDELKNL